MGTKDWYKSDENPRNPHSSWKSSTATMWVPILLCFLVGIVSADQQHAWQAGHEYTYWVESRTLAALHQVADQYTGIAMKAQLKCQPKGSESLMCKIQKPRAAEIHAHLPGGWDSDLPEKKTKFESYELSEKPFEIKFKNGAVDDLIVEKSLPTGQVNVIKSIVSQMQVDVQGENAMKSRYNQEPEGEQAYAVFNTMEDTVEGECETLYDISPLPEYVLQSRPELAPMPKLKGDGQIIDIVKTTNFSNCDQRVGYHWGFTAASGWEVGSTSMGNFVSHSSVSRIIVSGSLERHTIQSSVTTNKIIVSPALNDEQKGMVVSQMNLTLAAVETASGGLHSPSNGKSTGNLVGEFNDAINANKAHKEHQSARGDSADSDDSSSSEYDGKNAWNKGQRKPRSIKRNDDSSSSSSSSSESDSLESNENYWLPLPTLEDSPPHPMPPRSKDGRRKYDHQSSWEDPVSEAKKLANEIAEDLQKPSSIPKRATLEKFSNLATTIRFMNAGQIKEATQQLYYSSDKNGNNKASSSESIKSTAWKALRDAVAQAGTGPALSAIKDWISSRKVEGEEAARLVAVLPATTRHPTREYMNAFFSMATSQTVEKQDYLNSTAILAFTELVRESQVNNASAHSRYPVHSFGRLSPKNNPDVQQKWIPYIAKQLREAIREGYSPKIQVYIRALGNTAHPKMLSILEPYLEGQEEVSDFQRLMMVVSMDKLAKTYPKLARSVLYKIYQNTGETHQVRTAAVFQLMRTNPPASILQRMAEFTNEDTSEKVNAAVKSAIESAAELQNGHSELARNAQAAQDLLSPKVHGLHHSRSYLTDYAAEQLNVAYELNANWIGSQDSIAPQAMFATLARNKGGFIMPSLHYGAMVSSVDDLIDVLYDQFHDDDDSSSQQKGGRGQNRKSNNPFSPENLAQMLKIQSDDAEQLEGNIFLSVLQANRFMAFDNHTIERMPKVVKQFAQSLKQGQSFNYTKMYAGAELEMSFATATGLPFVYTLKTPSLIQLGGEIQARAYPQSYSGSDDEIEIPEAINATAEVHAVFSTRMEARIGFIESANNQRYVAGYDQNFQVNVPISAKIDLDIENSHIRVKIAPLSQNKEYNLVHYSSWPYTGQSNMFSPEPFAAQKHSKIIEIRASRKNEWNFGQKSTGLAFRATAEGNTNPHKKLYAWVAKMAEPHDAISPFAFPFAQDEISHVNYNLYWDTARSQNDAVVLTASYNNYTAGMGGDDDSYKHPAGRKSGSGHHGSGSDGAQAPQPSDKEPDSETRQEELLQAAADGIQDARAHVLDFGAEFKGQKKAQFAATIAYAQSYVDDKSRVVFYYASNPAQDKNAEVAFAGQFTGPNVPLMDFAKALKTDPTSQVEAELRFGEQGQQSARVQIKGELEQSEERRQYLRQQGMAQQCVEEMQEGNKILPACLNVTMRANLLDQGSLKIKYEQVPNAVKNLTAQAYAFARHLGFSYAYENLVDPQNQKDGQIDIEYEVSPDFRYLNVSMNAPKFDANLTNLPISDLARPFVAVDPFTSGARRVGRVALAGQFYPTCSIDNNAASTFDNKTYPIELGNCWHVIMTTVADDDADSDNPNEDEDIPDDMEVSIVCRDKNNNERECKLTLGEDEIQLLPNGGQPSMQANGRPIKLSENEIYRGQQDDEIAYEAYLLPGNAIGIVSEAYGIKAAYDGERIKIILDHKYRDQVRGLCGTFTGEQATDFTTPDNCILRKPEHFVASYALTQQGQCQGPAQENVRKAQQAPCYRQTVLHGNVVSDQQAGRPQNRDNAWGPNKQRKYGKGQHQGTCTTYRTEVKEEDGKICFSIKPVPACAPGCKAISKQQKTVQMHCVAPSSHANALAQRIKQGAHPDFSQKQHNKSARISVPEECSPA